MQQFSRITALVGLALSLGPNCFSQDAAKIMDQYVKAAGGNKALSKIQTYALDGAIEQRN